MEKLKAGQYARYVKFLEGEIDKEFLIQFIGYDDDGDLMFRMDTDNVSKLTVAKDRFPVHEWKSGNESFPIRNKTVIEFFETHERALEYVKWNS